MEKNLYSLFQILFCGLAFGLVIMVVKAAFSRIWGSFRDAPSNEVSFEEEHRAYVDSLPKCACGEIATESMPILKRSRGAMDFFREWFSMPPRYRRVVDKEAPRVVCESHAHVADALLDQFIHAQVRGAFSEAYAKVAIAAAGFEQEKLLQLITDSLTETQKRATRKATTPLRVLPKTGTEDGGDQQ